MSIINTLAGKGYQLKHEGGGNYRIIGHGGLIVKNDCWYSHSEAKGGGITTLMARLGEESYRNDRSNNPMHHNSREYPKEISTKHLTTLDSPGRKYLSSRGLDGTLVDQLAKNNLIMEDPRGYIAFVGYDENGQVRCISNRAYRNGLNVQRYETRGSDKRYSFSLPSSPPTTEICILCEGPIDALSIACLEHLKNQNGYFNTLKIATCGAPSSFILTRITKAKPRIVVIAFDNDFAGDEMTYRAKRMLRKLHIKVIDARPLSSKDPNDMLRKVHNIS